MVTADSFMLIRFPAVPVKLNDAFCPGVAVEMVTGAPPGTTEPEASAGTSYNVSVMLPVYVLCGSTRIVYVPVVGSEVASMKPPAVPINFWATSDVPSGFLIDT
jgi:hypothetical protein